MFFIVWGVHYFRRRNQQSKIAACPVCKRVTKLDSFDAKKWGHVYGIPLVPFGSQHVFDSCSACHRSSEIALESWVEEKAKVLARVQERYRREPARIDYAIEALDAACRFQTQEEATEIARHLEQDSMDSPEARARLASWYMALGQIDKAEPLMGDGLSGEATTDAANRDLARAAIASGNLVAAGRHLLRIAAPSRPDFINLVQVVHGLRSSHRDEDAAGVYRYLFERFPKEAAAHAQVVQGAAKLQRRLGRRLLPQPFQGRKQWVLLRDF